jgi:hypothetical protein
MSLSVIERAHSIVGVSKSLYSCNHVVNYALTGDRVYKAWEASDYLKFGVEVDSSSPLPMDVVVAEDGSHVGIFVSQTEWVHAGQVYTPHKSMKSVITVSSWKHQKVELVGLDQLRHVFPTGYQIRRRRWSEAVPRSQPAPLN